MNSLGKLLLGLGLVSLAVGIAVLVLSRYGGHKLAARLLAAGPRDPAEGIRAVPS